MAEARLVGPMKLGRQDAEQQTGRLGGHAPVDAPRRTRKTRPQSAVVSTRRGIDRDRDERKFPSVGSRQSQGKFEDLLGPLGGGKFSGEEVARWQ